MNNILNFNDYVNHSPAGDDLPEAHELVETHSKQYIGTLRDQFNFDGFSLTNRELELFRLLTQSILKNRLGMDDNLYETINKEEFINLLETLKGE